MAQIIDFFKKRYGTNYEKQPEKTAEKPKDRSTEKPKDRPRDDRDYKQKLLRHRLQIVLRILIIAAVVAVLGVIIYFVRRNREYTDYETINRVNFEEAVTAKYLNLNGNVLRFSKDGASVFNMQEGMSWNQTYEMQNPMIDVCGDYAAIGDYKGTKIYVFNSQGLEGEIDTTLPVQTFCISGTGNVATVLEENEVTWIKLFNKHGDLVANDRTTMAKSGYPVKVAISQDGIILGVSFLRIDTGVLSSSVVYYNFGSVGQNEIDNLVSGYDYSETVVSEIGFMNDKTSFALGDNKLIIYEGAQKPESKCLVPIEDEVQSVFYGRDYISLIYMDETGQETYRMEVYNTDGDLVTTCKFSLDFRDVVFNKGSIAVYNSDECIIFNTQGGEKFHGSFHRSIITMIPTGTESKYMLVTGTDMEEIQLK